MNENSILVIEDDDILNSGLCYNLQQAGMDPHPAYRLSEGREFLKDNGEIHFKTDDEDLFNSSLIYFKDTNFEILKKTYDLHAENIFEKNIETEHEKMFSEQGIKIKALIARKKPL